MLTQEQLGNIYIRSDEVSNLFDSEVPLSALVTFKKEGQPLTLKYFPTVKRIDNFSCYGFWHNIRTQAIEYVQSVVRSMLQKASHITSQAQRANISKMAIR